MTPRPQEWRPIATAPKDGTAVLAFWRPDPRWPDIAPTGANFAVAEYHDGAWRSAGDEDDTEWSTPSHWQPLPLPPKDVGQ